MGEVYNPSGIKLTGKSLTNHVGFSWYICLLSCLQINNFPEAHEITFEDLLFFLLSLSFEKHITNKHKIYFMIETVERNAMKNCKKNR